MATNHLDLNLLTIFEAIMREGSVTRASEQLAMTQPAVSNALSRMRVAWNDPVFVKNGRGIVPTPKAAALWAGVAPHLQALRASVDPEPFAPAQAQRSFRIAAVDLIVEALWGPLRRRFESQAPGVSLHASPYTYDTATARLVNAEVDAIVGEAHRAAPPQVRTLPLFGSCYATAMRAGHPAASDPLALEDYIAADHLLVSLSGSTTGTVDQALALLGLTRRVGLTVNHFTLVPRLLKQTNLIWTGPYRAVAERAQGDELLVVAPPVDLAKTPISLVWHERSERDPGHRWLREQISSVIKEILQAYPTPSCLSGATAWIDHPREVASVLGCPERSYRPA